MCLQETKYLDNNQFFSKLATIHSKTQNLLEYCTDRVPDTHDSCIVLGSKKGSHSNSKLFWEVDKDRRSSSPVTSINQTVLKLRRDQFQRVFLDCLSQTQSYKKLLHCQVILRNTAQWIPMAMCIAHLHINNMKKCAKF